jgi:hypothetical protein
MIIVIINKMNIVKDILDNIINYSLFFYKDEIVEEDHLEKYIIYLNKKINHNYCDLYFENIFSIKDVDDIITLEEYINRLVVNCNISNSIMIGAIIYLERLNIYINKYNIHKLLLISLLLSSKFLEDIIFNNNYWARCGGINLKTINRLEKLFLIKIKNNLYIHTNEFYTKFNEIFI